MLPPFFHQAIIRAEAKDEHAAMQALNELRDWLAISATQPVAMLGPYAAIMVRKAGQHRALLSLKAAQRANLHEALAFASQWLELQAKNHKIRFAIDVDPLETY
jgi:primosomal protein N' (replication factor Y)